MFVCWGQGQPIHHWSEAPEPPGVKNGRSTFKNYYSNYGKMAKLWFYKSWKFGGPLKTQMPDSSLTPWNDWCSEATISSSAAGSGIRRNPWSFFWTTPRPLQMVWPSFWMFLECFPSWALLANNKKSGWKLRNLWDVCLLLTLGTHLRLQEFKQWTRAFQQVLAKSLGVPGLSLGDTMAGDGHNIAVTTPSYSMYTWWSLMVTMEHDG